MTPIPDQSVMLPALRLARVAVMAPARSEAAGIESGRGWRARDRWDDSIITVLGSRVPNASSGACPFRHRRRRQRNGRSIPGQAGVLTRDDRDRTSRYEELVRGDALGEVVLARARAGDEEAFSRAHRTPPARAAAALLPHPRLGARRRGHGAGDAPGRLAEPRSVRGPYRTRTLGPPAPTGFHGSCRASEGNPVSRRR